MYKKARARVVANVYVHGRGVEDTPVEESARARQKCVASAAEELAGAPLGVLFSLARSEAALVFTSG